jgi:hypothetical protein
MSTITPPGETRAADGLPLETNTPPMTAPPNAAHANVGEPPFSGTPQTPPFLGAPPREARRTERRTHILWPVILIALGIVFLLGNMLPNLGSLLFLALGAAFLIARVVQREYGFAIPAGILLGFGTFVALTANGWLLDTGADTAQGGWFFILLGAGFLLAYLIGARPALIWPLFPATILAAFGLLLIGQDNLSWFARLGWMVNFWPLILVATGLWLLVRPRLTPTLRRPVGAFALVLLLVYAGALLAATVASSNVQLGIPGSGVSGFGFRPPISATTELNAPISAGETFRVDNTSGNTVIRSGGTATIQVAATTYRWASDQTIDVRLTPGAGTVTLGATLGAERYFGNTPYVDYTITVPDGVRVEARSSSGNIAISDVGGAVSATVSSGSISLENLSGAVTAQSSSGNLRLANIAGDLRATTSSGNINATDIAQPREFVATSGNIVVDGRFAGATRVTASSGNVTLRLAPESAVQITATTSSGAIRVRDLTLSGRSEGAHSVTGTFGSGAGTLLVQTSSGNVSLAAR